MGKQRKRSRDSTSSEGDEADKKKVKALEREIVRLRDSRKQRKRRIYKRSALRWASSVSSESAEESDLNNSNISSTGSDQEILTRDDDTVEDNPDKENQIEENLPPEVLGLLGLDKSKPPQLTEAIHASVARRWDKLLKSGMESEAIAELLKKYPPIANCRLVAAPQLNKQVASVLSEQHKTRDARLADLKNQLGASLTAIGRALSLLLNAEEDKNLPMIELLSDALSLEETLF